MKQFISIIISSILILMMSACRKFVEIPPPISMVSSSTVFSDSSNAAKAVNGVYASIVGNLNEMSAQAPFNGYIGLIAGLSADEFSLSSDLFGEEMNVFRNSIPVNSDLTGNIWLTVYSSIYKINACIEGLMGSNGISASFKNQLLGELKVLRAFHYFYLVNLFDDVPYITTTDYKVTSVMPRTASEAIYEGIINDLSESEQLLKTEYPTSGHKRPNLYTAKALLSKIYLYRGKWDKAENLATEIIASDIYSLETNLNAIFADGSVEAIWQLQPISERETMAGQTFNPPTLTDKPKYVLSDDLLNSFELNDSRKTSWVTKSVVDVNGTPVEYHFPYKYKSRRTTGTPIENIMVFRLSEIYLYRAESRARQGKIAGPNSAESDLNIIRNRAGLPGTTATSQDEMLSAIEHERRIEMMTEWGDRWLDLKRLNRTDAVMEAAASWKGTSWHSVSRFYPIPESQRKLNPFLTQNTGYN